MDAGLPVVIKHKRDATGNIVRYKFGPKKGAEKGQKTAEKKT